MNELTHSANGLILNGESIVLPESLQQKSIELAHRGAHPAQSGLVKRLRAHFYFHEMDKMTKDFVEECIECNTFTNKKAKETIQPHKTTDKCWKKFAVNLFWPMPSSKHTVVV